jgi:hypothetical protein
MWFGVDEAMLLNVGSTAARVRFAVLHPVLDLEGDRVTCPAAFLPQTPDITTSNYHLFTRMSTFPIEVYRQQIGAHYLPDTRDRCVYITLQWVETFFSHHGCLPCTPG